jgi:hypothetical protein
LNLLEFFDDIVRCTKEKRVCVIKTRTDKNMSNKRDSLMIERVPDVTKSLHVIIARLRDLIDMFLEGESFVQSNSDEFYSVR